MEKGQIWEKFVRNIEKLRNMALHTLKTLTYNFDIVAAYVLFAHFTSSHFMSSFA